MRTVKHERRNPGERQQETGYVFGFSVCFEAGANKTVMQWASGGIRKDFGILSPKLFARISTHCRETLRVRVQLQTPAKVRTATSGVVTSAGGGPAFGSSERQHLRRRVPACSARRERRAGRHRDFGLVTTLLRCPLPTQREAAN